MRITNRGELSISERCTKNTGHFVSSLICDIVAVRGNTFKYIPPATILKIFRQICEFLGSECERKIFCRDRENELCACGGCSPSVKVYRNVSVLECAQFWIPNQYIRMDNPGLSLFNGGQSLQLDAVCDLITIVFDEESGL